MQPGYVCLACHHWFPDEPRVPVDEDCEKDAAGRAACIIVPCLTATGGPAEPADE